MFCNKIRVFSVEYEIIKRTELPGRYNNVQNSNYPIEHILDEIIFTVQYIIHTHDSYIRHNKKEPALL